MENLPAVPEKLNLLDPEADLSAGAKAADSLVKIVKKAGLAKNFGGPKDHLFYEAWQSLAKFYGCTVRTLDAQFVEIDGIKGAKARAEIVDDATGMVVGGAEAYCMRDEKNWATKPWFQLASMAQTRAGSKAARNKFAYVPALAGFATCPAEEMDGVYDVTPQPAQEEAPSSPKPLGEVISKAQAGRFYAIAKSTGASDAAVKKWLMDKYGYNSANDIHKRIYDEVCIRVKDELSKKEG